MGVSGPGSTMLPKVAALALSAFGFKMLKDGAAFTHSESYRMEEVMTNQDRYDNLMNSMSYYSPNQPLLSRLHHWLLNPERLHTWTRPLIHVRNAAQFVWDNIIPIGLIGLGVTYAFELSIRNIAQHVGSGLSAVAGATGATFKTVGGSLWNVVGQPLWTSLMGADWGGTLSKLSPKHWLSLAAMGGLGIWFAHQFKREITGENIEELNGFKFLSPANPRQFGDWR